MTPGDIGGDDINGPSAKVIDIASRSLNPVPAVPSDETLRNIATMRRKLYLAYKDAGFSHVEAMELCCK